LGSDGGLESGSNLAGDQVDLSTISSGALGRQTVTGSDLLARAAHHLPDVGPDQPNRLGLPHDDHQCDKTGDYQEGERRPNARWAFTISVLLHPLVLIG
jgi:hypothetical protein